MRADCVLAIASASLLFACTANPATTPAEPPIPTLSSSPVASLTQLPATPPSASNAPTTEPSTAAPTPFATSNGACSISKEDHEFGAGSIFRGRGFTPDVPIFMTFSQDGSSQTITQSPEFPDLSTDIRGAFETQIFAGRADIGDTRLEVKTEDAACVAWLDFTVPAEDFPVAACEASDEPATSGGEPADDYAAAIMADEPMAYWRFEEDPAAASEDGYVVVDDAGSHDGTATGEFALAQPGIVDGSRSILMFGARETIVDVTDLEIVGDFTVESWLWLCGEAVRGDDVLVADIGGGNINMFGWHARLWTGDDDVVVSDRPVDREGWMHIAATRTIDAVALYQDGVRVATGSWGGPFRVDALGSNAENSSLEGWLDEVALYDHALSAEEVAAHAAFGQ